MSKRKATGDDEMRAEYDFSKGVRGKYVDRLPSHTRAVVLDHDVARAFPDDKAVNDALRALAAIVRANTPRKRK